jgi:hypothetical protein
LLDQTLIKQIITILDYLNCELDQPYEGANLLFEILHFKWWKISPITIAKVTVEANQLKYGNSENAFRKVLVDKTQQVQGSLFQEGGVPELAKAVQVLESLISEVPNVTLLNLVEQILQKTLAHLNQCDLIYVSFDVDCLDPNISIGTGTPVPNGMSENEAVYLLKNLINEPKIVALEITEINPLLDRESPMEVVASRILAKIFE